jgi:aspartate-semialdehyde dehydrogenase
MGARVAEGAPWGWEAPHTTLQVAVVGATGAVGRELLDLLASAGHPVARLDCTARSRTELPYGTAKVPVRPLEEHPEERAGAGWHLAFLCTPSEVSRTLAPALAERGIRVIDLSSAHRLRPEVPLVIPEINAHALASAARLVANPNCTTAIAALPLAVVERELGLDEVVVVSYQAASGAGLAGLQRLAWEAQRDAGAPATVPEPATPFAATLALNVIPAIAELDERGVSGEEQKIVDELRRILGRPDLVVEATTARVPVERCHSVAVHVKTRRAVDLARLAERLAAAPGIRFTTDPHGPRPRECAGTDPVHVGRLRAGSRGERSLCFFAVGDQLRKGAALNAFQVASRLPWGR